MDPNQPYQSTPQPTQPATPAGQPDITSNARRGLSSMAKVFIMIAIVLLIAAGAVFLLLTRNSAQAASNKFMSHITEGKTDEAIKLTNASSDSDKSFFNSAATAVKGSSKLIESGEKDKKEHFLYELSGATSKYARTVLEKQDGKWIVVSFVYNKDKLKLFPDANSQEPNPTEPATTTSACLAPGDFDTLFKRINGSTASLGTLDYSKPGNPYTSNVHFNPDTLDFSAPASLNQGIVDAFAAFGKQYADKDFTINLKGSVGTTKQSDLDFARQRSEKIKNLLVAGGTPAAKVIVDAPGSVGDYGAGAATDSTNKQTARNVVLKINSTCTRTPTGAR